MSGSGVSKRRPSLWFLLPLLVSSTFIGCSGDDGPTDGGDQDPIDVAGAWELTRVITANTCGLQNGGSTVETILLTASGDSLLVTNFGGVWGSSRVDGNVITIHGSEVSEAFGCNALLTTEGSGTILPSRITGTLTTAVAFDPIDCGVQPACSIVSSIALVALPESPCLDRATFGNPGDSPYILPYPTGAAYEVYQSYCWPTGGHRNQLAYDFSIPIGDPVVAARSGEVKDVRETSPDDGQGEDEHNFVFIEHDDGTAAFYAHLMQNSVLVEIGQIVTQGDPIASSGNSGQSGEPHLHFGVYADCPPVEGSDLPVNFRNSIGPLDDAGGLIRHATYTAGPFR